MALGVVSAPARSWARVIFGATHDGAVGCRDWRPADLTLSDEVLKDIDAAHRLHPMPY